MMSLLKAFSSLAVFLGSLQKIYKNWTIKRQAKELEGLNRAIEKAGLVAKQSKDTSEIELLFSGDKKK